MALRGSLYRKLQEREARRKKEKESKQKAIEEEKRKENKAQAKKDEDPVSEKKDEKTGFFKKHSFAVRSFGDMLTKIGCGMWGGVAVIYFFNQSIGKTVVLTTYYDFIALAAFSFIAGYGVMWLAERHQKSR